MSFQAIIVPDDVSLEKVKARGVLGAHVEIVRPASIVDKKQASTLALLTDYCLLIYLFPSVHGKYAAVSSVSYLSQLPKKGLLIVSRTSLREYTLDFISGKMRAGVLTNGSGNGNGHMLLDEGVALTTSRVFCGPV